MADKPRAIYEPGELGRVRGKLGNIDESEAKRMALLLGGEVGMEKGAAVNSGGAKRKTVEMLVPGRRKRPGRLVEVAGEDESDSSPLKMLTAAADPADDPTISLRTTYRERVKMDRYAAQFEYEIKNSLQVLISTFSFIGEPTEYVNPRFVTRRINVYYSKIEQLVTSTRNLFPRNNARRSERLKKSSPFVFDILDTIRHWDIEHIGSDLAKIQPHPRSARVSEFADILRAIYRPLFILEKLDINVHIKGAYKMLYKLLYMENPTESKDRYQELIRIAIASYTDIRREVHACLYPLLMKFISDRWFPYERLFIQRRRRFLSFINATEEEQVLPLTINPDQIDSDDLETVSEETGTEGTEEAKANVENTKEKEKEEADLNDPQVVARKAREAAIAAEQKALEHSSSALEKLFPQAGWEKLDTYPDLFPYFANIFGLRRGYELIPPNDPLQQTAILMHIMENICVALRYVSFGVVTGPDGKAVAVGNEIGDTITNWRRYLDDSFLKEYLPRLSEYCRMLEHSADAKNSVYGKKTLNELRWIKRLYFLPFYKFEALGPPPFKNEEPTIIYSQVKNLRRYLTLVASGIEQGNRKGGAAAKAHCNGIDDPWKHYHFEVPNPVSRRLDALIEPPKRNNAVLVFFALSTATILDNLLNNESSWAYTNDSSTMYRSINNEGGVPMFGVEDNINADQIFKNSLKKKAEKQQKQ